jgi:microcystin-dependent protein
MDYWGTTAPNSAYVFPVGQAISRTTYAALYAIVGTRYGAGNGTTTFNIPDKRGYVSAALDTMGGTTSADRLNPAITSGTLGATGGSQSKALITANLPPYTPSGSITNGAITTTLAPNSLMTGSGSLASGGPGSAQGLNPVSATSTQASSTFAGNAQGGTSAPVVIVQPTIMCNYIIRVA